MKHAILTTALIALSISAFSQVNALQIPFKGCNVIVITCKGKGDLYNRLGSYLGSHGYGIASSNENFQTLSTAPRATSKFNFSYVVNAAVVDSAITVTMGWKVNSSTFAHTRETALYEWNYKAGNNNASGIVYNDFIKDISGFDKESIMYYKR